MFVAMIAWEECKHISSEHGIACMHVQYTIQEKEGMHYDGDCGD